MSVVFTAAALPISVSKQKLICYDRAVFGAKATGVHSQDRPGTRVTFDGGISIWLD